MASDEEREWGRKWAARLLALARQARAAELRAEELQRHWEAACQAAREEAFREAARLLELS